MLIENFIHIPQRDFVFAYVPKVACTNWKSVFRYLAGHENYLDNRLAHSRNEGGLSYLNTLPATEAQRLLDAPDVPRYTFVRNPYSRALSAYLNKVKPYAEDEATAATDAYFHKVFLTIDEWRRSQRPQLGRVDFQVFLEWMERSGHPMARNPHWLPQHEIIGDELGRFTFVGRFEHLQRDAAELLQRMRCDIAFPSREAIQFPSSQTRERIQIHYTPQAMAAVEHLYAKDFALLAYPMGSLPD